MPLHLIMITLLALPLPWRHSQADPLQGWTLRARTDAFSTGTICRLTKPHMRYERRAVVIQLSGSTDTTSAVYRIDGGPPRSVQDDALDLARLGFALHRDDLGNPSGGLVRIPADRLLNAETVSVETSMAQHPAKFRLGGLAAALDAARKAGCGADSFN